MRKHGLATREFVHYINSVQAGGTASTSAHADGTGGCIHIGDDNPFFDNGFIVVMGFSPTNAALRPPAPATADKKQLRLADMFQRQR